MEIIGYLVVLGVGIAIGGWVGYYASTSEYRQAARNLLDATEALKQAVTAASAPPTHVDPTAHDEAIEPVVHARRKGLKDDTGERRRITDTRSKP